MSVYSKNLHRDEEEDKIDQEKIDKLISFIFLLIIGITPLIIIASTSMFYTPIIENDDIFTSGIKGDVYSLLKIKFFYLMSLIIIGLFTYKILFLNYRLEFKKIDILIFLLIGFIIIATLFSSFKHIALMGMPTRYEGALTYICYVSLFFVARHIEFPKKILKNLFISLLPFVVVNFILMTMSFMGKNPLDFSFITNLVTFLLPEGASLSIDSVMIGTLNQGNYMSGTFAVLSVMYLTISLFTNIMWFRLLNIILALITTSIVLMSLASSGFVTILFILIIIFILILKNNKKKKSLLILLVYITTTVVLIVSLSQVNTKVWNESIGLFINTNQFEKLPKQSQVFNELFGESVHAESNEEIIFEELPQSGVGPGSGRLFIWDRTLKLVIEKPFFGYGLDTLAYTFPQRDIEKHAQIETYKVTVDKPHNIYLGVLYGIGIFGFLTFVSIIIISILISVKYLLEIRLDSTIHSIIAGLIIGWFAYLFQGLFNDSIVGTSAHMWVIGGIINILSITHPKLFRER